MREGVTGYVPGSIVWVPFSSARPEDRIERESWLRRFIRRRQPSLYQRCLAMHIMTASDTDARELS